MAHSTVKPTNRMSMNTRKTPIDSTRRDFPETTIKGYIKISSISKTRNTSETRKNWIEKLCQLLSKGLKPHSKGLSFSLSFLVFRETSRNDVITAVGNATLIVISVDSKKI